jgi:putative transposase
MTVVPMCQSPHVNRAGFYRSAEQPKAADRDIELRDEVPKIALEWPAYGRRRITAELKRRGWKANHKRVNRIMREDNLLCPRHRQFVVTIDSDPSHPVYPNVAAGMELTTLNQLWVADITDIRLETEFVYLAVVLDAFSRRVVGWALDQTLEAALVMTALRRALTERQPTPGLVHHSDPRCAVRRRRLAGPRDVCDSHRASAWRDS